MIATVIIVVVLLLSLLNYEKPAKLRYTQKLIIYLLVASVELTLLILSLKSFGDFSFLHLRP